MSLPNDCQHAPAINFVLYDCCGSVLQYTGYMAATHMDEQMVESYPPTDWWQEDDGLTSKLDQVIH